MESEVFRVEEKKVTSNVIYDVKEEDIFDGLATKLGQMSEQEKQQLLILLQGYQAGVRVGMRMANGQTA